MAIIAAEPLTAYESSQIQQIGAWKAEHPNGFAELFRRAAQPLADVVERIIPDRFALASLNATYKAAELSADPGDIRRLAGVQEISELKNRPLDVCDSLATGVGLSAQGIATVEGAITGAGGVFTTLLDIPLIFVVCIRTILKTGHCYGYALDRPTDKAWVLGAVAVALSSTNEKRIERLDRLREIEDVLLEEIQEQVVVEEAASLLTQIEILADVPIIGTVSGALLNLSVARRIDRTARHLFQERWLRDNGKVDEIEPAPPSSKAPTHNGWSGALARAGYSTMYGLGYGASFPAYLAASRYYGGGDRQDDRTIRPAVDVMAPIDPEQNPPLSL